MQQLAAMRSYTLALIDQLQAFCTAEPPERQGGWTGIIEQFQDAVYFMETAGPGSTAKRSSQSFTASQRREFGRLLRDKRNAAGFSRLQLAVKAKLSDATIKFVETARHPPSRATLIRLIAVEELKLTWADVPGQPEPPAKTVVSEVGVVQEEVMSADLNCYITPTIEPVRMVMDLGRFLNGAGGHVEQTNAYLDHQSAAGYLAMCQQSPAAAAARRNMPLGTIAKRIAQETSRAELSLIALGSGDANMEVRLAQHLAEEQTTPKLRLCLFDVSQPLLSAGFKYAIDTVGDNPGISVWAVQGNFHHLPLYTQLHYSPQRAQCRRIYCMLGNTLANLDNEPRFFQHSLVHCVPGDMLVLDVQCGFGPVDQPEQIKLRDPALHSPFPKAHMEWLAGPIYRHCRDVTAVEFSPYLDIQCVMPGSYAIDAIATVKADGCPDRRFSMFRFKRYDVTKLAQCLAQLGWEQLTALPCGNPASSPGIVMLFCKRDAVVARSA